MNRDTDDSRYGRLEDTFWERHSNPKSGWSRVLLGPVLLLAVYRRDLRLFVLPLLATVINPIAFARPDPEEDSWMTRAVRAERWWLDRGNGTFGVGWPNALTTLSAPLFGYSMYAAYTKRPLQAAISFALSIGLKFAWVEAIARQYDVATDGSPTK